MDNTNKRWRRKELCNPEYQHRRDRFWQVLPFGESKGPCWAEKQKKREMIKIYILKSEQQPIKTRFAESFEQEWTSFLHNPLSFLLPAAAAHTLGTGPLKTLKPMLLSNELIIILLAPFSNPFRCDGQAYGMCVSNIRVPHTDIKI